MEENKENEVNKKEEVKAETPEAKAPEAVEPAKEEAPKAEAPAVDQPAAEAPAEEKADEAKSTPEEAPADKPAEEEDDLTGIEEASEKEIVEKVKKKGRKKKKRDRFQDKQESEWVEKVIQIRRVTKVVKGGKKLSFRAVVVVGNAKDQVGVGVGKASEVIGAIQKAVADAKKTLVKVKLIQSTLPHQIIGREGAARVLLKPAREGTGIIAGGAARTVLELGGVGDILSKSLGSRNPLNVARATLDGLKSVNTLREFSQLRGLAPKELLNAN